MKHDMHYAEAAGKLYTAVVSDILDSMELRKPRLLSPHIRPLDEQPDHVRPGPHRSLHGRIPQRGGRKPPMSWKWSS